MTTPIFDSTVRIFEDEIQHSRHLDQKASNLIGFIGIIVAVIGFVFGSNILDPSEGDVDKTVLQLADTNLLLIGIALLLIAITLGILVLTPLTSRRPVFKIKEFHSYYAEDDTTDQEKGMLPVYFELIDVARVRNNQKALILYMGNIAGLAGLAISFISLMPLLY